MKRNKTMIESWQDILRLVAVALIAGVLLLSVSLFELYTQLGRYKAYWNQQNTQAQDSAANATYIAFGDSAAQGVGATRPQNGYVSLVADHIRHNIEPQLRVINLSKSGAKIKDVIDTQLPAFEKLNVEGRLFVTVEIGANDILTYNAEQFETEMDTLMQRLPKETVISDIPFFGKTRYGKLQPNVDSANEIMYRLAAKHGFTLAALHDKVKNNGGLRTMAADIFHPSNKGYRENWAPAFIERIGKNK